MELQVAPVYGPVQSRRLGRSLGVNVAPAGVKVCNFNCVYCQYGWTERPHVSQWPDPSIITAAVDEALVADTAIDRITVAGNGEPTLHPAFARIVDGLFAVRARRAPQAKLAILSNASTLSRLDVRYSLARFDERHMKLDAGDATTLLRINACPVSIGRLIGDLRTLGGVTLQSMFVRDSRGSVDNTTPAAIAAWLGAVEQIKPELVHVYSLDRKPARASLLKVPPATLEDIARRVEAIGVKAQVFN
jgi:wyosine [tRNA(Phe)-imidazoG37] synthetase (radical SAM superfamily)